MASAFFSASRNVQKSYWRREPHQPIYGQPEETHEDGSRSSDQELRARLRQRVLAEAISTMDIYT